MKQITLLLSLTLLTCLSIFGQKLTLTDLTTLCNKKNWEDINQILLLKKWEFYDSKKGDTYYYNTITWSFNKEYYSDASEAWFYLYTFEGFPNKISYSVFNKESYTIIQNSISSAGYKLVKSEVEDNAIISTYSNANYILKISTYKREKNDDYGENRSITSYNITLIKKEGVFDPDNGNKKDYFDDGTVKGEYTLKNGLINGIFKFYHPNGKIKKIGNYINDKENGLFKEYNEDGVIESEYNMKDGELNGPYKFYFVNGQIELIGSFLNGKRNGDFKKYSENGELIETYSQLNDEYNGLRTIYKDGKVTRKINYLNGITDGLYSEFIYIENDSLILEYTGIVKDELKEGVWNFYLYRNGGKKIVEFTTYKNDIKNGQFKERQGDSLILGSYKNDELDGNYKIYIDFNRMFKGGMPSPDLADLTLIVEGNYNEGVKSGYWKIFDYTIPDVSEGRYLDNKKSGEWKYYNTNWSNDPLSEQLYLIENYSNGLLDGKSIRYSYIEKIKFPCSEIDDNKNPLDTCITVEFHKILETSYYINGKLNGPFEFRDSTNKIIAKGFYKDGLKDGEWNEFHVHEIKMQYRLGKLIELIMYDSLRLKQEYKFEIFDEKQNSFKCRKTQYLEDIYTSQEYSFDNDYDYLGAINLLFQYSFFSEETTKFKDGEYKVVSPDNHPYLIGNFYKNNKIGVWSSYFYDQKVKINQTYKESILMEEKYLTFSNELFTGEFLYYDPIKRIKEVRKVKNGLRNGKTVYFDTETNKKFKTESYKNGVLK